MSRIAAQRPAHPRIGLRGRHGTAILKGTGADTHATGGGATAARGFTLVIGHTGAGTQAGGAQKARRLGNTGGGGSRIADASAAGQPRTVPQTLEQIPSTPLHKPPIGRGPHGGAAHTGGAHW